MKVGGATKGGKVPNPGGDFQIRGQVRARRTGMRGLRGGAAGVARSPGCVGEAECYIFAQGVPFQERCSSWRAAVAWAW